MTLRAAAFEVDPGEERLAELFGPNNEVFRGNAQARCHKCLKDFPLKFALVDNPDNPRYLRDIEQMISGDCKSGVHRPEYFLKTRP